VSSLQLAFVHYPGRLARLEAARAGAAPTEFLFGALELEQRGHRVLHYEVDPASRPGSIARRLVDRIGVRPLLPPHLYAAAIRGTRALLDELRQADVVIATTTGTAIPLALWRRLGLLRTPLVGMLAGLVNAPWRPARRLTTSPLLRVLHTVLYGAGELPELLARDPRLTDRVHVVPFGVDASFWTPDAGAAAEGVLAIGNDGQRDWDTLVRAARTIDAPVRILTGRASPSGLPANVSWEAADWHRQLLTDAEVRDAYRRAAVVVVPVRDVRQPSGQSVTLQAMACARPVVLSRTQGLWQPEALHDGENILLVPPGDADALAGRVNGLLRDPATGTRIGQHARDSVEHGATVADYAARLERVCEAAIACPGRG
jgi:glycosyltransferase involved in cell wall biosynthesis